METVSPDLKSTRSSIAQCIHAMLQYTVRKDLSLIDVMGLTSHAFRIRVDDKAGLYGPTSHVWGSFYRRAVENLGFEAVCFDPIIDPIPPEHVEIALGHIHRTLDRDVPAVVWDLFGGDFAVVYGYDDERQLFHAKDREHEGTVPYEKLSRGHIMTLTIVKEKEFDYVDSLSRALAMALTHGRYPEDGITEFRPGLAAYDAWIRAFETRSADPLGNSYNALYVYDARRFAVQFLNEVRDRFRNGVLAEPKRHGGYGFDSGYMAASAEEAARHYAEVASALGELHERFPFPHGGDPSESGVAETAVRLLQRAKASEEQGLRYLARMYYDL
ncbi:hypothetical protein [Paenibacillus beijingensis]|uniref:Butirosin biosynthesis protein H N-terminal domain-containing protein n=1 Tax=Paenibacillus beijingensis TaxID=1126833 RepID=A0A0D5NHJ6_9BACL|nr:hypothetical protein [Paenibacillus beijingensis]AJY74854.1 hypothetical protein VN24_09945 [Paenibacillus beijingensis]